MAVRVFLAPGGTSRPATPRYGDSLTPRSSPNAAAVTTPSPSSTVSAASGRKAQVRQHQPSQHQAGTEPDSHSVPVVANHKRAAQPARRATPEPSARREAAAATSHASSKATPEELEHAQARRRALADVHEFNTKGRQMTHRISIMEKERDAFLGNTKSELWKDFSGFLEMARVAQKTHSAENTALMASLRRIKTSTADLHKYMSGLSRSTVKPVHIQTLQRNMDSTEADITAFKERQCAQYNELLQEEKSLSRDVDAMGARMEAWDTEAAAAAAATPASSSGSRSYRASSASRASMYARTPNNASITAGSSPVSGSSSSMATPGTASDGMSSSNNNTPQSMDSRGSSMVNSPPPPRSPVEEAAFAVQHIDDTIARQGGNTGGWSPDEHATFLRLRTMHGAGYASNGVGAGAALLAALEASGGIGELDEVGAGRTSEGTGGGGGGGGGGGVAAAPSVLTMQVAEETCKGLRQCLEHESWYLRHTALLAKKKEAIAAWKVQKNLFRESGLSGGGGGGGGGGGVNGGMGDDALLGWDVGDLAVVDPSGRLGLQKMVRMPTEDERHMQKEELLEWRQRRVLEEAKKERESRRSSTAARQRHKGQLLAQQAEAKAKVVQFQEQRREQKAWEDKAAEQHRSRRLHKPSKDDLAKLHAKDSAILLRKKEVVARKVREEAEKVDRLNKLARTVERKILWRVDKDENRLLHGTIASREKSRAMHTGDVAELDRELSIGFFKKTPNMAFNQPLSRARVGWRQGL